MNSNKSVGVVGAPLNFGQPKKGVEKGPKVLRDNRLLDIIENLGWNVKDYGDLPLETADPTIEHIESKKAINISEVSWGNQLIKDAVAKSESENQVTLLLGGDHSVAIGSISGSLKVHDDLCVLWIDAHADINTPELSESGNMHGMPVSYLMGIEKNEKFDFIDKYLPTDRFAYIGLRDVDEAEKVILKQHQIKAFSMTEVDKYGIGKVVEMALDHINPNRDRPIHLSFDIDGIDSSIVPSTGTPVEGGLNFREGRYICETIAATGKLVCMDMVEVNPDIAVEGVASTVHVGTEMIKAAFGKTLL